jgi:hypothetical protein
MRRVLELTMRWEIVEAQVLDQGVDLATLCNLGSLLHLLLLHFLTLAHPFLLLFFLLERECVREMRGEWVGLKFRCWEISLVRADMWAMPFNGWQPISHSIYSLCTFIGWSGRYGGLSDRLWFHLSKLKNLISLTLSPCWGLQWPCSFFWST